MALKDEGANYGYTFTGFGPRLRELLRTKNMSQARLAGKIGKSTRVVSMYLSGARRPRADVLTDLAEALGVTTDYLCMGSQPGLGGFKNQIKNIAGMATKLSKEDLNMLEQFTWALKYGDHEVNRLLEQTVKAVKLLTQDRIMYTEYLLERKIPSSLAETSKGSKK